MADNNSNDNSFQALRKRRLAALKAKVAAAKPEPVGGAGGAGAAARANNSMQLKKLYNNSRKNNTRFLGKGAFGAVRRVTRNRSNYALKRVIFNNSVKGPNNIQASSPNFFNKEVRALQTIKNKHKNSHAIKLINSGRSNKNGYIMTELLTNGESLDNFCINLEDVSDRIVETILINLILGLQQIHDAGYLHLDIKPENIWVFADGNIKYMDFGLACKMPCKLSSLVGTRGYFLESTPLKNGIYSYTKLNDFHALQKTFEYILEVATSDQKDIIRKYIAKFNDLNKDSNITELLDLDPEKNNI